MATQQAAVEVTLRSADKLDSFETRAFLVRSGAPVHIGRASKNTTKPELGVSPTNAYIDSPTISREHAVLAIDTAAPTFPAPSVCITDNGSMHGTMVNGNRLAPNKPQRLNRGDILTFGANVTRDQHFYTARQFTFEPAMPSFPHGFTVPEDIESSDEEDLEVDEALSCPPRYGSLTNPVTIEDVEEPPVSKPIHSGTYHNDSLFNDQELDEELVGEAGDEGDVTHYTVHNEANEDVQERSSSPHITQYAFVEDASASSDSDVASEYSSENDQELYVDSCASVDGYDESQSDEDIESESGSLQYDDDIEEEEPVVSLPEISQVFALAEVERVAPEQQQQTPIAAAVQEKSSYESAPQFCCCLADDSTVPGTKDDTRDAMRTKDADEVRSESSDRLFSSTFAPLAPLRSCSPPACAVSVVSQKDHVPELFTLGAQPISKAEPPQLSKPEPPMGYYFNSNNGSFDDPFSRNWLGNLDCEMPPRPTAPRPMQWSVLDYTSPFSPPANVPSMASRPLLAEYSPDSLGQNPGHHETVFPTTYAVQRPQPLFENSWDLPKVSKVAPASRVQTPPPALSAEVSSPPPPPARRTKVSIPEIVEDAPLRPPTPTSVSKSLKRKAEALDEPVPEADTQSPSVAPQSPSAAAPTNTAIDERPKKRMRSRIGGIVKTAAAWMVPAVMGAAASVTFLTSVPNDFFVA